MGSKHKRTAAALLVTVSFLLLLAACGKSVEERWQEQYDLGQKYLAEMDYEQALLAFTNAIEIDPQKAEAYIKAADAYIGLGDIPSAIAQYEQAIRIDASYEDELTERIASLQNTQNTDNDMADDQQDIPAPPENELDVHGMELAQKFDYLTSSVGDYDGYVLNCCLLSTSEWQATWSAAAEELAYYMQYDEDNFEVYGNTLQKIYYALGDMDSVLSVRKELYERTHELKYDPDGFYLAHHTVDMGGDEFLLDELDSYEGLGVVYHFNGYGMIDKRENEPFDSESNFYYEYRDDGRLVKLYTGTGAESIFKYDEDRKLTFIQFNTQSSDSMTYNYVYDGSRVTQIRGNISYEYKYPSIFELSDDGRVVSYSYQSGDNWWTEERTRNEFGLTIDVNSYTTDMY